MSASGVFFSCFVINLTKVRPSEKSIHAVGGAGDTFVVLRVSMRTYHSTKI